MNLYLLLSLLLIIGCDTENISDLQIDRSKLIGEWINIIEERDTLFIKDTIIIRTDLLTLKPRHAYKYSLKEDSIKIRYVGEYYIYAPELSFKIFLDYDILTIENFSTYFPKQNGDVFSKLRIIK
jgi:hypothetical protein